MFIADFSGIGASGGAGARSRLKALDPRAKTLACLLVLAGFGFGGGVLRALPACALLLAGLAFSGSAVTALVRGLRPVVFLCVFAVLLHGFATPGNVVAPWLPLTVEGLTAGALLAAQLALAASLAALLVVTTPVEELAAALAWLFRPLGLLGLPVEDFFRAVGHSLALIQKIEAERVSMAGGGWRLATGGAGASEALKRLLLLADGSVSGGTIFNGEAGFKRFGFGEWLMITVSLAAGPAALAYL